MKNPWLVIAQVLFSLTTLVSGVMLAEFVVVNKVVDVLISVVFLLDVLLPFVWFWDDLKDRIVVDRYFVFSQAVWIVLFGCFLFKYGILPGEDADMFVGALLVGSFPGLRLIILESFLKQER